MPLFHSNAVYAGWSVALGAGRRDGARSVLGVAVPARRPPLRRDVHELRRQAAGLHPGHRRAARRRRQSAAHRVRQRGQRPRHRRVRPPVRLRGVGRLRVDRDRGDHHPARRTARPARSARASPASPSTTPRRCRSARSREFDETGALVNADAAIGELVNTTGSGLFRGYYNDPGATDQRMRHGMYWSGDLAYRDADGWIYLAGRTADWMRVDGENLTTAPIERILLRLPPVSRVAVYPVPDEYVGDQVMAAIVLRDDADLSPDGVRRVPCCATRSVAEGVAAPCLDRRRPAQHGDQQDPQARAGRPRHRARRSACCGSGTAERSTCTGSGRSPARIGDPALPRPASGACRPTPAPAE